MYTYKWKYLSDETIKPLSIKNSELWLTGFLNSEKEDKVRIGKHAERGLLYFILNSIPTVVLRIHKASETCQRSS